MSDNLTTTVGTLASDDVGGVHYPRTKVSFGPDNSASDVAPDNPLPVDSGPSRNAFAITPDNTSAISPVPRAVRVNAAGTVVFRAVGSSTDVTITAIAGEVIPVRIQYLRATGTTATGFLGYA